MVDLEIEVKSSARGVTRPYHCDKIHAYRCDKEVGVIGVDVSKDKLTLTIISSLTLVSKAGFIA